MSKKGKNRDEKSGGQKTLMVRNQPDDATNDVLVENPKTMQQRKKSDDVQIQQANRRKKNEAGNELSANSPGNSSFLGSSSPPARWPTFSELELKEKNKRVLVPFSNEVNFHFFW